MAPLLYVCIIETLLIKIRSDPSIKGFKSPTSNEHFLLSAFADDTNFFNDGPQSTNNILSTFDTFGKASGSKINLDKTEAMWLGRYKNRIDQPLSIKWVNNVEVLGMFFGYENVQSLNWITCIDRFKNDILKHF